MRPGHKEAQDLFLHLGELQGYRPQKSFSLDHPTDGVWFQDDWELGPLPIAAAEVIVTEGKKSMRGSIATLEAVSPAIGIVIFNDDEVQRGLIRAGCSVDVIEQRLSRAIDHLNEFASTSKQRIQVWRFEQLQRRHQLAAGLRSPYQIA